MIHVYNVYVSPANSYKIMRTLNCPFKAKRRKETRDSVKNDQKHTILSYNIFSNINCHVSSMYTALLAIFSLSILTCSSPSTSN